MQTKKKKKKEKREKSQVRGRGGLWEGYWEACCPLMGGTAGLSLSSLFFASFAPFFFRTLLAQQQRRCKTRLEKTRTKRMIFGH
jgi:hypothetical protein